MKNILGIKYLINLLNKWASVASCKAPIAAACQLWMNMSSNFGTVSRISSGSTSLFFVIRSPRIPFHRFSHLPFLSRDQIRSPFFIRFASRDLQRRGCTLSGIFKFTIFSMLWIYLNSSVHFKKTENRKMNFKSTDLILFQHNLWGTLWCHF